MSTAIRCLVDTSAWIDALRKDGDPETRRKVTELARDEAAVLCEMVLLELWNGARGKAELAMIRELETELEVLPVLPAVWRAADALARDCRAAGFSIPATDLVIAACADHHRVGLLHRDSHFDQIAAVREKRR